MKGGGYREGGEEEDRGMEERKRWTEGEGKRRRKKKRVCQITVCRFKSVPTASGDFLESSKLDKQQTRKERK